MGSPPRMRGKGVGAPHFAGDLGITPACAGKSYSLALFLGLHRDHPRVCGEKRLRAAPSHPITGSPPRVWGKGQRLLAKNPEFGITPAYAGKSLGLRCRPGSGWDHPRVCGEKMHQSTPTVAALGSPPRMRGKVGLERIRGERVRITPAYAGKRLKRSHSIGHFSCILRLFHSVLHRASASGGSRAGPCAPPCLPAQNAVPV